MREFDSERTFLIRKNYGGNGDIEKGSGGIIEKGIENNYEGSFEWNIIVYMCPSLINIIHAFYCYRTFDKTDNKSSRLALVTGILGIISVSLSVFFITYKEFYKNKKFYYIGLLSHVCFCLTIMFNAFLIGDEFEWKQSKLELM